MGSEESFYHQVQGPISPTSLSPPVFQQPNNFSYLQPAQMGPAPTFPTNEVTYRGGMAPTFRPYNWLYFQTPVPSFTASISHHNWPWRVSTSGVLLMPVFLTSCRVDFTYPVHAIISIFCRLHFFAFQRSATCFFSYIPSRSRFIDFAQVPIDTPPRTFMQRSSEGQF